MIRTLRVACGVARAAGRLEQQDHLEAGSADQAPAAGRVEQPLTPLPRLPSYPFGSRGISFALY